MNKLDTQLPQLQQPEIPIITKQHVYGFLFLFVVFGSLIFIIYDWQYGKQPVVPNKTGGNQSQICIQVITSARNLQSGEVKDFPTPCDVPEGWEEIGSAQIDKEGRIGCSPNEALKRINCSYITGRVNINSYMTPTELEQFLDLYDLKIISERHLNGSYEVAVPVGTEHDDWLGKFSNPRILGVKPVTVSHMIPN